MTTARPHVLMMCLDGGIKWSSPKGAAIHLRMMAAALEATGARVSLLTTDGVGTSGCSVSARFEPMSGAAAIARYHGRDGRTGTELAALALCPHAFEAARRVHEGDPIDVVYERYSLFSDIGARLAVELGVPFALEVNAPLILEQTRYRKLVMHEVAERIERRQLETAERVFVVSRPLREWAISRGAAPERTMVLPNTAERRLMYRGAYEPPAAGGPFTIGFAGSLKPWHGVEALVEVFARVHAERPFVRLEVLGDGPLRNALEADAQARGAGAAIDFLGHVPYSAVPEVMARWHLVVAPYPALDGFYFSPLKIVEALAAGRPVMASAAGDIPDLLDGGRLGVLLPPGDAGAWRRAMLEVIDNPRRLSGLAAEAERETRDWSWTRHAEHVLRETLTSRRSADLSSENEGVGAGRGEETGHGA